MTENKYVIDDILNAIVNEKPVDLQAAVNSMMVDKAHDEISGMKTQLMQDMMDQQGEDDEEQVDDDIEEFEDEPEDEDQEEDDEVEELDAEELFNDETDEEETE